MSNDDRGNNFMSRTRIDQWNFNSNTFHQSFIVHFGINRNQMIFSLLPNTLTSSLSLIELLTHYQFYLLYTPPNPLRFDSISRIWHSYDSIWPSSSAAGAATRFISFFFHWFLNIVHILLASAMLWRWRRSRSEWRKDKCAKNGNTGFLLMRSKSS